MLDELTNLFGNFLPIQILDLLKFVDGEEPILVDALGARISSKAQILKFGDSGKARKCPPKRA